MAFTLSLSSCAQTTWPEDLADLLNRAHTSFRVGDVQTAVELYARARKEWEASVTDVQEQLDTLEREILEQEEREEIEGKKKSAVKEKSRIRFDVALVDEGLVGEKSGA